MLTRSECIVSLPEIAHSSFQVRLRLLSDCARQEMCELCSAAAPRGQGSRVSLSLHDNTLSTLRAVLCYRTEVDKLAWLLEDATPRPLQAYNPALLQ
jgi:hypothetical protein